MNIQSPEIRRLDDPDVRARCLILKRVTDVQNGLLSAGVSSGVLGFVFWMEFKFGHTSKSGRYYPPDPAMVPYATAVVAAAFLCVIARYIYRVRYIVEPVEHCLYRRTQFLWHRRTVPIMRPGLALCITAEGKRVQRKYGSYWAYRTVAVSRDGTQEPLSSWRREGLDECNAEAARVASALACASKTAPTESKISIQRNPASSELFVDFADHETTGWWKKFRIVAVVIIALVIIWLIVQDARGK